MSEVGLGKYNISDDKLMAKSGIHPDKARLSALLALLVSFGVPIMIVLIFHDSIPNTNIGLFIYLLLFVILSTILRYYVAKILVIFFKNRSQR